MRPKRTLTVLASLFQVVLAIQAQTPTHQAVVHNMEGSAGSNVNDVAYDDQGHMLITGWRSDAMDFGGTLHPQGVGAIFLAKFDGQGNEVWSKVSGSADQLNNHRGMSVAVDANGNIYNCGWVFAVQEATFDGITLPLGTYGFVAKYSASGTLLWVKDFNGGVNAIAVDGNGNPFINLGDATIEKLDPANGNSVASGAGGGDLQNVGYHNIVVDASNNVIAQWGNKITKYDNALNVLWSTPLIKPFAAESHRITVDENGDAWATFYAVFGTVTLGGTDYSDFPKGYIYSLDGATGAVSSSDSPGAYKMKEVYHMANDELIVNGDFAFNAPYIVKYDASLTAIWSIATFGVVDMERIGPDCFVLGGSHNNTITLDGTSYERPNNSGQDNAMAAYLCAGGVGMDEHSANTGLMLFPVPASHSVTMTGCGRGPVRVFNASGTLVMQANGSGPIRTLPIDGLPAGLYVVREATGRSVRLVVER